MSKKLGIILTFIGAYVVLLGGLFWLMAFTTPEQQALVKPYDWVWGLLVAIVILVGGILSCKPYILGFIGCGVELIGVVGGVLVLLYGKVFTTENYLSPLVLAGTIITAIGFTITLVFHIKDTDKLLKYGKTLM